MIWSSNPGERLFSPISPATGGTRAATGASVRFRQRSSEKGSCIPATSRDAGARRLSGIGFRHRTAAVGVHVGAVGRPARVLALRPVRFDDRRHAVRLDTCHRPTSTSHVVPLWLWLSFVAATVVPDRDHVRSSPA
jgi:hypothetical protein